MSKVVFWIQPDGSLELLLRTNGISIVCELDSRDRRVSFGEFVIKLDSPCRGCSRFRYYVPGAFDTVKVKLDIAIGQAGVSHCRAGLDLDRLFKRVDRLFNSFLCSCIQIGAAFQTELICRSVLCA